MDLSVWQALYAELEASGFMVISVAMEARGSESARPWIELVNPDFPVLIDQDHRVAELYNMVNVPQAVWIDEEGRIVRPTETSGTSDAWRALDRTTFAIPEGSAAELVRVRGIYSDAVRDWVANGAASRFVYDPATARARTPVVTDDIARANACFRLGRHLRSEGKTAEGDTFLKEAIRLRPDSWNFWRQTADLMEVGGAASPDFFNRVDELGQGRYYAPIDMDGMPK